ncbi:unnamed protein product, partial [Tilletia controversa]
PSLQKLSQLHTSYLLNLVPRLNV